MRVTDYIFDTIVIIGFFCAIYEFARWRAARIKENTLLEDAFMRIFIVVLGCIAIVLILIFTGGDIMG